MMSSLLRELSFSSVSHTKSPDYTFKKILYGLVFWSIYDCPYLNGKESFYVTDKISSKKKKRLI